MASQGDSATNNIVLIGMPGAGKSTVGVVLAKVLNHAFVDVDLVIQQTAGRTLHEIIDEEGIEGFIKVEGDALASLDASKAVISTGGSAVYSEEALERLGDGGTIVYLKIRLAELEKRLSDFTERGVVMRGAGPMSLRALYEERAPLYERFADVTVDVSGLSIAEAVQAVRASISRQGNAARSR